MPFLIDNELLIALVEERPILWDRTLEDYNNRFKALDAWKEICAIMKDGFDEISEKEQDEIGRFIKKRWTNLKDSFARWLKKYNETGGRVQKYVYYDQLVFLKKIMHPVEIQVILEKEEQEDIDNDITPKRMKHKISEPEIKTEPLRKDYHLMTTFKERMMKTIAEIPTTSHSNFKDRHMSFFSGIVPSLENFNEDQICDFQIGVLQLIQSLKRRENEISVKITHLHSDN
ncbi:hypothetical protein ABEB36_004139 [Hypothenemus hampei]|uniref:MADF domain-containing protein n=1 Tax=Hypothenemus hampei TaxID=57062 RepID=A0ABD1F2B0_HYPHA